jgi:8-oxo-dGTP pyrophosphatase MutT (NUDIX family)
MTAKEPASARPSATTVVARNGSSGPEVLLVRRRAGDAFGDSYAFPGGVVDHDESNAHVVCEGRPTDEAEALLGVDDALDYFSAAIRELFEETGILLARDSQGEWASDDSWTMDERNAVDKGELPWPEFLGARGLCMAGDALHYFAYWETPYARRKRWQTRFFLAELPPGQSALHDGSEVTDSRWVRPADALQQKHSGDMPMPFPTVRTLRELSRFGSVPEIMSWADERQATGIVKIRPAIGIVDGKQIILVPGDAGYEEADREWRKN